jgi:hypothetical protein
MAKQLKESKDNSPHPPAIQNRGGMRAREAAVILSMKGTMRFYFLPWRWWGERRVRSRAFALANETTHTFLNVREAGREDVLALL